MICPSTEGGGVVLRQTGLVGAASGELVDGVRQLRPEDAMTEAMLRGWRAQQCARGLRADTIDYRERLVRRFVAFTNELPWRWGPGHVDEWTLTLTAENHLAPATVRGYQTDLRLFSEYLTDARYGWTIACEEAFGEFPVPICHEWNTIAHLNDYEGSPEARPLSREELQRFLDYADDQVERAARARRKGGLAAYRDATMFKVIYGWGLRRTETSKLDLADWGRNSAAPVVRPLRNAARALRQGGARPATATTQRRVGDGLGSGRSHRLRGQHTAPLRDSGSSGVVGNRARLADQTSRDQRPLRNLPRRPESCLLY